MSSPYIHSQNSVKKFGGKWENYLPLHEFLDSSKMHEVNWQHRACLHHGLGVEIGERLFGPVIDNGDGKMVETRYILIEHIKEDCDGKVPTVKEWLDGLPPKKFALNFKPDTHG